MKYRDVIEYLEMKIIDHTIRDEEYDLYLGYKMIGYRVFLDNEDVVRQLKREYRDIYEEERWLGKTLDDIIKEVNSNFDHELEYANERKKHVENLLGSNEDWIIELISRDDVRGTHVKSKKDFLSEDTNLGKALDRIADYILFPKFDTEQDENLFNSLRKEDERLNEYRKEINKIKKGDDKPTAEHRIREINIKIDEVKRETDKFKKDYLTSSMRKKNKAREKLGGFMQDIKESQIVSEAKTRTISSNHNIRIDEGYWDRMGYSDNSKEFRQDVIRTYEESIEILKKQLGLNIKDMNERKVFTNKLINQFDNDKLVFELNGTKKVMNGKERYFKMRKMYGELVSDFNKAKEILVRPIEFKSLTSTSTEYNFNEDTWYYDESNEIVEVSRNLINFSDPNTYKGLILTYYDLDDKYKDNFNSDMWGILRLFEDVLNHSDITKEEASVVSMMMKDMSRQDIMDEFEKEFGRSISDKVLSTWINRAIPSKLAQTYKDSVDEWLYTYMIKGKYKRCTRCEQVKLISNDRYFRERSDSIDGFRNECRICEASAKSGKK